MFRLQNKRANNQLENSLQMPLEALVSLVLDCICAITGATWIYIHTHVHLLTFVASGLDINSCVLSYFEGTANLHCYTSCTLTTLHCNKVSFLQCCHMKRYNKIFTKMWGVYSLLWDTVYIYIYICYLSIRNNFYETVHVRFYCWLVNLKRNVNLASSFWDFRISPFT